MATRSPVVLFAFNRPHLLSRVLERILEADPAILVLVADGPRPSVPGDREKCSRVLALLDGVECGGLIERSYSEVNLGAGRRIASGLDWVFSKHSRAIILEDDLLPEPSLFPYCDELLERYQNEENVAMISGCNFQAGKAIGESSYYFSACAGTLGWATWARAWSRFDFQMTNWPADRSAGLLERVWPLPEIAAYWRDRFDETYPGKDDIWDYQWAHTMWRNDMIEIYPNCNLVSHIGFGPDATHVSDPTNPANNLPTRPMGFPLRHPTAMTRDLAADVREFRLFFQRHSPSDLA